MKILKNVVLMSLAGSILFIASCGKDDEPDPVVQSLIGVWQSQEITLTDATVAGEPFFTYMLNLGYTEAEVNTILGDALGFLSIGLSGAIEFKSDMTYTANFGLDVETGTWAVVNDGNTLNLTETGGTETTELTIISIGATRLEIGFQESIEEDYDGNGSDEEVILELELSLDKAT